MKNIYLVGMMCSGKSTVGKILSKRLGCVFVDTDGEIEKQSGKKIGELISLNGNDMFQEMEAQHIKSLSPTDCVVSTGGRAFLYEDNVAFMKSNGISIFLNTSPAIICNRLQNKGEREKRGIGRFSHDESVSMVESVYQHRLECYKKSDMEVCGDVDAAEVCDIIIAKLRDYST